MTSLPIMVFAVLDFQYEKTGKPNGLSSFEQNKKFFLTHPSLYEIGLKR